MGKRALFAFDFDVTLTEEDTDRHAAALTNETTNMINNLARQHQWTDLVNLVLAHLRDEANLSSEAILSQVSTVPVNPIMPEMASYLADSHSKLGIDVDLAIISDSNTAFIAAVLESYSILPLFKHIITNTANIDHNDRIIVERRHDESKLGPHGCPNGCAVNLCKGKEIELLIAEAGPFDFIVYSGDGKNDWCPSTKLGSKDFVCPREGHKLNSMILQDSTDEGQHLIKAKVLPWSTTEQLFAHFKTILENESASKQ